MCATHSIRSRGLMRARLTLAHTRCSSPKLRLSGLLTVSRQTFRITYVYVYPTTRYVWIHHTERRETWYMKREAKWPYPHAREPWHLANQGRVLCGLDWAFSRSLAPPPPKAKRRNLTTRPVVPEIPHPTVLSVWCHDHLSSSIDIVLLVACSVPMGAEQGGDSVP